jgi:8-oxo-dGTP diphosphatase
VRGDGDGWRECGLGHRHWGRHGAAGLLLRRSGAEGSEVLLQLRALWSHHGGTWGLPGGARDSDETAREAALREAVEEVGIDPTGVRVRDEYVDDHGGWAYTTVVAVTPARDALPEPHPGGETVEVRWVAEDDVDLLPLHPGFAATWPALRGPGSASA